MLSKNRILLLLILPLILAACKIPQADQNEKQKQDAAPDTNTKQESTTNKIEPESGPSIFVAKAPNEQYQTVLKDSVEWRQGRFETGSPGGQLKVLRACAEPTSFNPWAASDSFSQEVTCMLFRGLADIDAYTGEVIPDMAAEIKEDNDHLTYTTRLRKGLKWSDGTPISSADVAFTWNTLIAQGYATPSIRESVLVDGKMPKCNTIDELTNTFVLSKPSLTFKRVLASIKVAPRHAIESTLSSKDARLNFKQLWAANKDLSQMVSSGPFTLFTYEQGHRIELARSSNFYMCDKIGCQLPYLDRLIYIICPDAGMVVYEFGNNGGDLAHFRPRDYPWLKSQAESKKYKLYNLGPAQAESFLVFNMNPRQDFRTRKAYVDPIKSAWFNDVNFRQAINHALNRQKIVSTFFKGIGTPLFTCEAASSPLFNQALKPFSSDTKLALSLLAKSAFTKKSDGQLYDSSGNKVEFNLTYCKSTFYEAIANELKDNLKELGIKVNFEVLEPSYLADLISGKRNWEAQLFTITDDPLDSNSSSDVFKSDGCLHLFDQREADQRGQIMNEDARPFEKRLDEIYAQAQSELDKQKRKELYFEVQKIIYDEAPFIYIASPQFIVGARDNLRNYSPTQLSQAQLGLHNVEELFYGQEKAAPAKNSGNPN